MNNLTTIVTGASSGIGRVIAEAYLKRGAKVAVCARRLESLQEIFGRHDNAAIYKVDVSDAIQIANFVKKVEKQFGGIDILLNNAAVLSSGRVEDMNPTDWTIGYRVNVEAPFLLCKYVLPGMKERNFGRIINMSSGGSVACGPEYSLYSSTKAAINAFTKSLGRELEGTNVKANTMSPGPCKTEMFPENPLSPDAAVSTAVYLATLPEDGPNGRFFWMEREVQIIPNLSHVNWADPNSSLEKI
jgi:NAD(P)-dependent dehydrogenase (short-subunit alcohol dehydrogenase family)